MHKQEQHKRQAGVLLHISSLPSGNLGQDAYQFVDFLASTGVSIWQTLPINMPHADNSPYQCVSAHAANTAFINVQQLVDDGLVTNEESASGHQQALNAAYHRFMANNHLDDFDQFCETHQSWLKDFSLYSVLRQHFNFQSWDAWGALYKNRDQATLAVFEAEHKINVEQVKFNQYLFFKQWDALKNTLIKRYRFVW